MSKSEIKRSFLQRFRRAKRGATIVIFSFMTVPIMALSAGVVDYGTALRVKGELNATLDAAVLAATQAYALDDTVDYTKIIKDFIAKNYSESGKVLLSSSLSVEDPAVSEDGEVRATLNVKVPTNFLTLVGFHEFDFTLGSSAKVGGQSLEVALVLDNTWSMNGSKLTSLKSSANILVDKLMIDGATNVKLALVPFADYVNIGVDNRSEAGLDIPDAYTVEDSWCDTRETIQQCDRETTSYPCTKDGVPSTCSNTTYSNCTTEPNPNFNVCYDSNYDCLAAWGHELMISTSRMRVMRQRCLAR